MVASAFRGRISPTEATQAAKVVLSTIAALITPAKQAWKDFNAFSTDSFRSPECIAAGTCLYLDGSCEHCNVRSQHSQQPFMATECAGLDKLVIPTDVSVKDANILLHRAARALIAHQRSACVEVQTSKDPGEQWMENYGHIIEDIVKWSEVAWSHEPTHKRVKMIETLASN